METTLPKLFAELKYLRDNPYFGGLQEQRGLLYANNYKAIKEKLLVASALEWQEVPQHELSKWLNHTNYLGLKVVLDKLKSLQEKNPDSANVTKVIEEKISFLQNYVVPKSFLLNLKNYEFPISYNNIIKEFRRNDYVDNRKLNYIKNGIDNGLLRDLILGRNYHLFTDLLNHMENEIVSNQNIVSIICHNQQTHHFSKKLNYLLDNKILWENENKKFEFIRNILGGFEKHYKPDQKNSNHQPLLKEAIRVLTQTISENEFSNIKSRYKKEFQVLLESAFLKSTNDIHVNKPRMKNLL